MDNKGLISLDLWCLEQEKRPNQQFHTASGLYNFDVSPFILPMGLVTLPIFNINLIDLTIVLFYMLMDSYEICLLFALHYNIQCI